MESVEPTSEKQTLVLALGLALASASTCPEECGLKDWVSNYALMLRGLGLIAKTLNGMSHGCLVDTAHVHVWPGLISD
jgi:hypothetical protein